MPNAPEARRLALADIVGANNLSFQKGTYGSSVFGPPILGVWCTTYQIAKAIRGARNRITK